MWDHWLRCVGMRAEDSRASLRVVDASDLLRFRTIADVACSPDGSEVAYTLSEIDPLADDYRTSVWIVSATGGEPRRLSGDEKKASGPRWSADGKRIAYLSDREREKPQLHVIDAAGGEPRRVTDLALGAMPASWSPDGTRLLFGARVPDVLPPTDPEAKKRWEARPRHITRSQYKADGQGYTFDARTHLFVADVASGSVTQITDGDFEDRAEAWSPDGKRIVWARTRSGLTDYNQTDLFVANADGSETQRLTTKAGRPTSPTWSPDGKRIAFYAYDDASPWIGDPMLRPWVVSANGGDERPLTKRFDHGVTLLPPPAATPGPIWSPDSRTLTALFAIRGDVHIVRVTLKGATETLVDGQRQITYLAAAPGKRLAYASGDPRDPSELFTAGWDGRDERGVTSINDDVVRDLSAPVPFRRMFDTPNGKIEGWVIAPPKGPAPLLVDIHGGPAGWASDQFSLSYFLSTSSRRAAGQCSR